MQRMMARILSSLARRCRQAAIQGQRNNTAASLSAGRVSLRIYYSSYHLFAAKFFSNRAEKIENDVAIPKGFSVEHRAYVTSAVLSSAAFLEAAINEVYADTADDHTSYVSNLTQECRAAMKTIWAEFELGDKARGMDPITKYQLALRLANKSEIEKDRDLYENVKKLSRLRNALTHFKPSDQLAGAALEEMSNLERGLIGKFQENRLMAGMGNPFFPDKCLGSGCSQWSVRSAKKFADEFFTRMNFTPNYQVAVFKIGLNDVKLVDFVDGSATNSP